MKGNIEESVLLANRKKVGQQLKEARESQGLSQEELAEKTGFIQSTISKIEAGKWSVSLDMLFVVCEKLGITIKFEKE